MASCSLWSARTTRRWQSSLSASRRGTPVNIRKPANAAAAQPSCRLPGKDGKPETLIPKMGQEALADMRGPTRWGVSFFMNTFTKLGFIDYHAGDAFQVHSSLLNIVLHD